MRRCFGVFGDPIAHSRSPAMHGAAFDLLGLPHVYLAFAVAASQLGAALRGAAALGFGGVNLTVPHKRAALSIVDELSARARRIGAVNTVIFGDGRLHGDNTDSPGFARALAQLGAAIPRRVMVLGGGGAARAVVDGLLGEVGLLREAGEVGEAGEAGVGEVEELLWVSRDPAGLDPHPDWKDRVRCLAYPAIERRLGVELVVNCTTVGMHGGPERFPVELALETLEGPAVRVIDIVYPRPPGGLLDRAQALGAAVQDGREMLLWQGVLALERWLGEALPEPAIAAMRAALAGD